MDFMPDEMVDHILTVQYQHPLRDREYNRRHGNPRTYSMVDLIHPLKIYKMRTINRQWRRVIDSYSKGFHKYCVYYSQTYNSLFDRQINSSNSFNGVKWLVNNGHKINPSIIGRLLKKNELYEILDLALKNRSIYDFEDRLGVCEQISLSNNVNAYRWMKKNNIKIKQSMLFTIRDVQCMNYTLRNNKSLIANTDINRLIGHIMNNTIGGSKDSILNFMLPIISKKYIDKDNAKLLLDNCPIGLKKIYIDTLVNNLLKQPQTDDDIGYFMANIVKDNSLLTIVHCLDKLLEKYTDGKWFHYLFYKFSYDYLKQDNIQNIIEIVERYTLPERAFNIRIINRCINMMIDNESIIKLIELGFNSGKQEIITACHCSNNDLIKYLADNL